MAIHIFCYSNESALEVNGRIESLITALPGFFASNFSPSNAGDVKGYSKKIAAEAGLQGAKSLFLIRLADKSAAAEISAMAASVRNFFPEGSVLTLFENETAIK